MTEFIQIVEFWYDGELRHTIKKIIQAEVQPENDYSNWSDLDGWIVRYKPYNPRPKTKN